MICAIMWVKEPFAPGLPNAFQLRDWLQPQSSTVWSTSAAKLTAKPV